MIEIRGAGNVVAGRDIVGTQIHVYLTLPLGRVTSRDRLLIKRIRAAVQRWARAKPSRRAG